MVIQQNYSNIEKKYVIMSKRGMNDATTNNYTKITSATSHFSKCYELHIIIRRCHLYSYKFRAFKSNGRFNDVADFRSNTRTNRDLHNV